MPCYYGALLILHMCDFRHYVTWILHHIKYNKKAQLSLTNPRDAKACQNCSDSTCLQCCRWQYWPIFIRLAVVASEIGEIPRNLLKIQTYGVQGHPRSSILVSIESPYVPSYSSLIVTLAVSATVFEIFTVKHRLESWGYETVMNAETNEWWMMRWWMQEDGSQMSWMNDFERSWRLVCKEFRLVLSKQRRWVGNFTGERKNYAYWGRDLDLTGSRDVVGHVTIRFTIGHFLLVVV